MLTGRGWTDIRRTPRADLHLGALLAFVAGAANAGGFLAVGRYTSHMTGIVSAAADSIILGHWALAAAGLAALAMFLGGAMTTAVLVNVARQRRMHSRYALPLMLEALLLLAFGLLGATLNLSVALLLPVTVLLLCYMMGLQNAVITKISRATIRTTHITGLVTDLGIELGKLVYINRSHSATPVVADRQRMRMHGLLIGMFFVGGLFGAMGFKHLGFVTTLPLAAALMLVALRPMLLDLRAVAGMR
ncbi:MAG: DUF1275 domain-containing protein [Burkholderiaceae bacterium]|nr:DUF1275 domain-containing protein [Burkholderiaceae bacterium]